MKAVLKLAGKAIRQLGEVHHINNPSQVVNASYLIDFYFQRKKLFWTLANGHKSVGELTFLLQDEVDVD